MWQKIDSTEQARSLHGEIPVHHRYTVGLAGERFFRAMRDESILLASRCPACGQAFLPPKIYCEECFEGTTEWLPVEGPGYVVTFTILHLSLDELPLDEPQVVGLIAWEGIRGGLLHRIGGAEPGTITSGMAVAPVWSDSPSGSMEDIVYFRPVEGS